MVPAGSRKRHASPSVAPEPLAERHSFGELRLTHEQDVVFADVEHESLHALWLGLDKSGQ